MSSVAASSSGALSADRKAGLLSSNVMAFSSMGYPAYLKGSRTWPYRRKRMHWALKRSRNLQLWGPCRKGRKYSFDATENALNERVKS